MSKSKQVMLLDLTSKQRSEIRHLAQVVADKFSNHPDLSDYVKDIFQTKSDKAFKININALASTLEYKGFSPEDVLRKFKEYYGAISVDRTWVIYKDDEKKANLLFRISSKDFNQHIVLHILFFIMRGTAVKKTFKKMQKQWVHPLSFIFQSYKTDKPPKGSELKKRPPNNTKDCFVLSANSLLFLE